MAYDFSLACVMFSDSFSLLQITPLRGRKKNELDIFYGTDFTNALLNAKDSKENLCRPAGAALCNRQMLYWKECLRRARVRER